MEVKLQTQNGNENESVNGNMISQIYDYIKMEDEILNPATLPDQAMSISITLFL